jgi:hypothetical protein
MKCLLVVLILSAALGAQDLPPVPAGDATVTEHNVPITRTDLYCAGFIGKPLPKDHFVAAGLDTPYAARYGTGEYIYLSGSNYTPGTRVSIVRALRDPNQFAPFPGEEKLQKQTGQMYADLGYAVVLSIRGKDMAVAKIEFGCDNIVPGDQVVAFVAKDQIPFRATSTLDLFPAARAAVSGRIAGSRDFTQYISAGSKIYLNVGAVRGVKPGDYVRVVRGYHREEFDAADGAAFYQTITEDTQKDSPRLPEARQADLPRHLVGEAVVLSTQSDTATAMVTFALQDIHIGDTVELEENQQPH